jgi:hypothetical protein
METAQSKPNLTASYVAQLLKENNFKYEEISENKVVVEIDKVKFNLSCKGKDVVWSLIIPFQFWLIVSLFFAAIILIFAFVLDGSPVLLILGIAPTYFLYRYKPSTIKAKGKLMAFLKNNFE